MTQTSTMGRAAVSAATSPSTKALLNCGVVAWPLFLVVGFAQALTRDGFDLERHPFSFLSLGDLGWIQITNFVVTGLLFLAAAVGMRRLLRGNRGGTWGPLLFATFAISLIGGGVFVADPAFGFPPGAPDGQPDVLSWHGVLHGVAFGLGALSLIAACFVFARLFASFGQRGWATYSTINGIVVVAPLPLMGSETGTVVLYVVAVVGWIWTSVVAARLVKEIS
jgi:hypothetical protein